MSAPRGLALVLGGAACVWSDAVAALALATPSAILVINDMIPLWPEWIDFAVTLHPDKLAAWLAARAERGLAAPREIWAHRSIDGVTNTTSDWAGSSGLFAVKIALECGYSGVLLAGVPMDRAQPHFVRGRPWASATAFHKGWIAHMDTIKPNVRSLGGWTRDQLGAPTAEWLAEIGALPPDPILIERNELLAGCRPISLS